MHLMRSHELGELSSVVYDVVSFIYPKDDAGGATRAVKLLRITAARRKMALEQLSSSVAGWSLIKGKKRRTVSFQTAQAWATGVLGRDG